MQKYGAYQADPPDGDITWFRTGENFSAGAYIHGNGGVPNVYIEDSVAALIMRVGPAIDVSEKAVQSNVNMPGLDEAAIRKNMADQLTDELVGRLTDETNSIWQSNPHWLKHVRPAPT